jgi:hypothetical protein
VPEFREALVEWLDVGAPLPADTPPAVPAEPVSGVVVDAETGEPLDLSDDGRPF